MYTKVVRAGSKSYTYYYHNVKIMGKVRNICLGTDPEKAQKTLDRIMRQRKKSRMPISSIIGCYWKPRLRTA